MSAKNYIDNVCKLNRLQDMADWLAHSNECIYFADRHVEKPPANVSLLAACSAGLALLFQWAREVAKLREQDLFATEPILVIDQEWLDGFPDAPPPHVLITLAKREDVLPLGERCGKAVSSTECPICGLLSGDLSDVSVLRIEPSLERESQGSWLFTLKSRRPGLLPA